MNPALGIALLWLAFAATHVGLSSLRLRPRLVHRLGRIPFLGLYSIVALVTFVPLVRIYFDHKHAGPHLWYLGAMPGMRWLMYLGMGTALALVVAGAVRPSPAAVTPGKPIVKGVFRVTRHPVFMGVGIFGLVHLLVVPVNAAEFAFFAPFPLFALLGCAHQDRRKLATGGADFATFYGATPFLPFSRPGGALRGIREDLLPIAVGVAVAVVVRTYHQTLFG